MTDSPRLLDRSELAEQGPQGSVGLPIDLIDPNPNNPRKALTEIEDLANSIKTFTQLQPIVVRPKDERYELIGGHRRWAAILLLGEKEPFEPKWRVIDAVVRSFDDNRAQLALISSQVHHRSWTPREEAAILEELATTRTLDEVGGLVHKSQAWVGRRLRVYADSVLSGYVQTGRLPSSVAEELLTVKDAAERKALAEQAVAEGWSKDVARSEMRKLRLDYTLAEIGRKARELLSDLAVVDPSKLTQADAMDLLKLRNRLRALATGEGPRFPTMAEAAKAAGVSGKPVKTRRTRLKIE